MKALLIFFLCFISLIATGQKQVRTSESYIDTINKVATKKDLEDIVIEAGAGTVTSVGLTTGTSGTDISVSGSPVTTSGSITINIPTASATNKGVLSTSDWSLFNGKQAALVSGTNIKTINSQSLLGSGDIEIEGTGGGTVTSVAVSGGTTGLTTSGGPVTSSGTITLSGTLAVANGGTGVTTSTGTGSVVLSSAISSFITEAGAAGIAHDTITKYLNEAVPGVALADSSGTDPGSYVTGYDFDTQIKAQLALSDTMLYLAAVVGLGNAVDTTLFSLNDVIWGVKWGGDHSLKITKVTGVVYGTSPDIDIALLYDDNFRDATPTEVLSADLTITSTTTGSTTSSMSNATVAPGKWLWIRVDQRTAQPTQCIINIYGHLIE